MKTFEVDVEIRMRRTLLVNAPDAAIARAMALMLLSQQIEMGASMSAFLQWTDGRRAYRPMPVETIIDNDPVIVDVRPVPA